MKKEIILLSKQGFCYGVKRSIQIAIDTVENNINNEQIHLLGHLVHNKRVSDYMSTLKIKIHENKPRILMIDDINEGIVLSTAHGIGSDVYKKINNKNLSFVDATCPNVKYVYNVIKNKLNNNYIVLYICNKLHPEAEAVKSFSNNIILLDEKTDIPSNLANKKIVIINQTTVNINTLNNLTNKIINIYPHAEVINTLCKETIIRQEELNNIIKNNTDAFVIIVGDKSSHNTKSLYNIANKYTNNIMYILDETELDLNLINKYTKIIIASGTSTPNDIVEQIINKIIPH